MINDRTKALPTVYEAKEDTEEKECDKTTTYTIDDVMSKMSDLFGATMTSDEIKDLHNCYHELDKRLAIMEALVSHMMKEKERA
jgi:hypothetical protein